ncbi:beta-N-acetylhexosaminidase [soil metagenome]
MAISIVPRPESVVASREVFTLDAHTTIAVHAGCERSGELLAIALRRSSGFSIPVVALGSAPSAAIEIAVDHELSASAYTVSVGSAGVVLSGGDPAGAFWATQVFLQLCPPDVFRSSPLPSTDWRIPGVRVTDRPRFAWRGMLIDVSRHFFGRDSILKLIDVLALHRMNVLHLHLTDDQGWRMEIKRYPLLTEVGSWRANSVIDNEYVRPEGGSAVHDLAPHSGYLTHDDLREIVAYAAARFITVVPEIDIPGHSQAAIAAYPQLGNSPDPLDVWTDWGINPHVLNVNDSTIEFYRNVFDEVLDVFPGEYIHVGGDEVPKDEWKASAEAQARIAELGLADEDELQSWFISTFESYLSSRGRRLLGWDEILEGGLPSGATVMSWRGEEGGILAAEAGHDVIMTPDEDTYLYHRQSEDRGSEPAAAEPIVTLRHVFDYDPMPAALAPAARRHVLGAQCQMWTEFVSSERQMHEMVFPRLCAFADAVWRTGPGDFAEFEANLPAHLDRLHAMGIDGYRRRPAIPFDSAG